MNGDHEHVVFNPAGLLFRILCFRDATGAAADGAASGVFTWFSGYLWRLAACRACGAHLGWRYEGAAEPRIFFGLIKDMLTTSKI
ncbi:cereblon family protein [Paramagnetospirillum kuznetsovii]|nr:cereblon family protein [Paramagnetospirillum kuznetsovii]